MSPHEMVRFFSKVSTKEPLDRKECWEWRGSKNPAGYGLFRYRGACRLAHRVIAEHLYQDRVNSMLVCHKCDNPSCVNPDHLFLGTHKDNSQDCSRKGRLGGCVVEIKTHCHKGHEYSQENTYINSRGHRECRICRKNNQSKRSKLRRGK